MESLKAQRERVALEMCDPEMTLATAAPALRELQRAAMESCYPHVCGACRRGIPIAEIMRDGRHWHADEDDRPGDYCAASRVRRDIDKLLDKGADDADRGQ